MTGERQALAVVILAWATAGCPKPAQGGADTGDTAFEYEGPARPVDAAIRVDGVGASDLLLADVDGPRLVASSTWGGETETVAALAPPDFDMNTPSATWSATGTWSFGTTLGKLSDGDGDWLVAAEGVASPVDHVFLLPLAPGDWTTDDAVADLHWDERGRGGSPVAVAGANGELWVSDPTHDEGQGRVARVRGPVRGNAALEDADTVLTGAAGAGLGASLANLGDANGDGLDDVIVGSAWLGLPGYGEAYWLYDTPSGVLPIRDAAAAVAVGPYPAVELGWSVAGGDVDGDGLADGVVAVLDEWHFHGVPARVFVFSGPVEGTLSTEDALATVWLSGAERILRLAHPGDIDGDGSVDLAVTDYTDDRGAEPGVAWVVWGPISGAMYAERDATIFTGGEVQALGWSVASGMDLSGDGRPDVALSAFTADANPTTFILDSAGARW